MRLNNLLSMSRLPPLSFNNSLRASGFNIRFPLPPCLSSHLINFLHSLGFNPHAFQGVQRPSPCDRLGFPPRPFCPLLLRFYSSHLCPPFRAAPFSAVSVPGPRKTFRGADCFYTGQSPDAHKVHRKIHQSKSRDAPLPPRESTGDGGVLCLGEEMPEIGSNNNTG